MKLSNLKVVLLAGSLVLSIVATSAAAAVQRIVKRPRVELYDHKNDPFEMNNLAGNPEYQTVLNGLQIKLDAWLDQQGDSDPVETELAAVDRLAHFAKDKTQKMLDGRK